MDTTILKWVLAVASVIVIALLFRHAISRARALSRRIDEYHAEQEAKKSQPGPIDPYAEMERLRGEPEDEDKSG